MSEPRVGDIWGRDGERFRVERVSRSGVYFDCNEYQCGVDLREHFTLKVRGAVTLAEREYLGIMPTLNDDDRTPLERAKDRVSELEAEVDVWVEHTAGFRDAENAANIECRDLRNEVARLKAAQVELAAKLSAAIRGCE